MKTEWSRFELITEDEERIAALDALLDQKQLSRWELAIILLSLRVRPGISEAAFGTELQDIQERLLCQAKGYRGKCPFAHED